jgi:hypothetical protein
MPHMTMNEEEEEGYEGSPLSYIGETLDELIQKGGASAEELKMLKKRVQEVQQDVDGGMEEGDMEEEGNMEGEPRAKSMSKEKHPGIMIAIGLRPKGVKK